MKNIKDAFISSSIRMLFWIGLVAVISILLAACVGEPSPPSTQGPVETEQVVEPAPTEIPPTPVPQIDAEQVYAELWQLVGYGDAANPTVVEPDTVITLAFSPDGTVSGSSGCNNYSSTYELESDGSLKIATPFAVTMTIGICAVFSSFFSSLHSSSPSMPGSMRSSTSRSGT